MSQTKSIKIIVEVTEKENRTAQTSAFTHDHVTGKAIKEAAHVPERDELFAIRDDKFHLVANDATVTIKDGEIFVVIPHGAIIYTVNGEPQWTIEKELTPETIMSHAGIDPAKNYLVEIKGHEQVSFKDDPKKLIHMHDGMKFITNFVGPKPVSAR